MTLCQFCRCMIFFSGKTGAVSLFDNLCTFDEFHQFSNYNPSVESESIFSLENMSAKEFGLCDLRLIIADSRIKVYWFKYQLDPFGKKKKRTFYHQHS